MFTVPPGSIPPSQRQSRPTEFTEMSTAGEGIELAEMGPLMSAELVERARHELSCGANVLHYAAHDGHLEVLRDLLKKEGASVNEATKLKGWAPLHFAAYKARADVVELLLQHDANAGQVSSHS